eukprot:GHVS01064701.1.p1 GENE.GHVS01064701.1~~GHVS01064701.1.p1  ORF type:complete len:454 (+),score=52.16 GHVS01064701.1:424-1785(+)
MDVLVGIHNTTVVILLLFVLILLLSLQTLTQTLGATLSDSSSSSSTASVRIRNELGHDISGVTVVHKYSDENNNKDNNLADKKIWNHIKEGEICDDSLNVLFNNNDINTTNGSNWWKVFWYSKDGSNFYQTDPQNFPGVIDGLETFAETAIPLSFSISADTEQTPAGPAATTTTVNGVTPPLTIAARKNLQYVLNSQSTSGFKEHILGSEDINETIDIVLREDGMVTFMSQTGNSTAIATATKIRRENAGMAIIPITTNATTNSTGNSEDSPLRQSVRLPNRSCTRWGWKFYTGYDLGGGSNNIKWMRANHRNKCQSICRRTRGCRAYSWTAHKGTRIGPRCYLKRGSRRGARRRRGIYSAMMCGRAPAQTAGLPPRQCTRWGWRFYDGYDLGGGRNDIRWVRASHRNRCQPICRADRRCRAYSWAHRICYLKRGAGRRRTWRKRGVYSATMC